MKYADTSQARLAYVETTDPGLPLLMIHGNSTSHQVFRSQWNLWDKKVHDLPGIGHAPFWEAPVVFDAYLSKFLNDIT